MGKSTPAPSDARSAGGVFSASGVRAEPRRTRARKSRPRAVGSAQRGGPRSCGAERAATSDGSPAPGPVEPSASGARPRLARDLRAGGSVSASGHRPGRAFVPEWRRRHHGVALEPRTLAAAGGGLGFCSVC